MIYTVLIEQTERGGWFWRVAEDVRGGRGWSGESESAQHAAEAAYKRLRVVIASRLEPPRGQPSRASRVTNPLGYYFGERRELGDREQINLGPCRACGENVWVYRDEPRKDELPIHKRLCAERDAELNRERP